MAQSDCDHTWKQNGYWDGRNIESNKESSGILATCTKCNEPAHFLHEDWRNLADEQKIPLTAINSGESS